MTNLVVENLRLKELLIVVDLNKPFYDEFVCFLNDIGYDSIFAFVNEQSKERLTLAIEQYFKSDFENLLHDGIGRPYNQSKSKWFFISWLLRDAPQQRVQPIVASVELPSLLERRTFVLLRLISHVAPLLQNEDYWEWPAFSEVMLQRLEGSRRALKGGLFEAIVRDQLKSLFKKHNLKIKVTDKEVRLNDETYDVELICGDKKILMPVKTRETMGGGHSLLFTRDIHKSIAVAHENHFNCIPIVIAESWGGNLDELACDHYIFIQQNPNQLDVVNPKLEEELENLVDVFSSIQ